MERGVHMSSFDVEYLPFPDQVECLVLRWGSGRARMRAVLLRRICVASQVPHTVLPSCSRLDQTYT